MRISSYTTCIVKTLSWTQLQNTRNSNLFCLSWSDLSLFHHHCGQRAQLTSPCPWASRKCLLGPPYLETGPLALLLRYGCTTWKGQCPHDCESTHCCWLKNTQSSAHANQCNSSFHKVRVDKLSCKFRCWGHQRPPHPLTWNTAAAVEPLWRKLRAAGMNNNWTPTPSCAWLRADSP